MSIEEFIQHQAVSGCLTMEDRQYLELRDVERVIQMVRDECKQEDDEFEIAKGKAYWYFIAELADAAMMPNENGVMPPLRFREGCGLHPFPVVKFHTRLERSDGDRGWNLKVIVPLALERWERLSRQITDNSDSGGVAFLLPFNAGYVNTWDGMHKPKVRISYDRIESTLYETAYALITQPTPAEGFDSMIAD